MVIDSHSGPRRLHDGLGLLNRWLTSSNEPPRRRRQLGVVDRPASATPAAVTAAPIPTPRVRGSPNWAAAQTAVTGAVSRISVAVRVGPHRRALASRGRSHPVWRAPPSRPRPPRTVTPPEGGLRPAVWRRWAPRGHTRRSAGPAPAPAGSRRDAGRVPAVRPTIPNSGRRSPTVARRRLPGPAPLRGDAGDADEAPSHCRAATASPSTGPRARR